MRITGSTLHHSGVERRLAVDDWGPTIAGLDVTAVIFDCDGTLVDSSTAHFRCMQEAAALQGEDMSWDWYSPRTGLDRASLFKAFESEAGPGFERHRAIADSIAAFPAHQSQVVPIPETVALVRSLHAAGYLIAVGTNAERTIAMGSLERAGIAEFISALASISDDLPPKPHPALFEKAAKDLEVSASKALVIEDSPQGLAAARSAGMAALHIQSEPRPG